MADKSLIAELLMTPSDIRKREEAQRQQEALNRQSGFGRNMGGVAGMFANYGGPGGQGTRQALRLGGEALGIDMRSPAEKQAAANQGIMRTTMGGSKEQLQELLTKLMNNPNSDPRAIAAVRSRLDAIEKREFDRNKGGELGAADKKAIRAATEQANAARVSAEDAVNLAIRYIDEKPTGGILGTAFSGFRKFIGSTEEVDLLKANFNKIRMSGVLSSLPPGPASDKDIANAEKGFPTESFSAEQIASWLKGYAKAKKIEAGYRNFYAKYLSDNNGNSAGVNEAWKKHFEENVELYWTKGSSDDETPTPKTGTEPKPIALEEGQQPGASPNTGTVPQVIDFSKLAKQKTFPNEEILEQSGVENLGEF